MEKAALDRVVEGILAKGFIPLYYFVNSDSTRGYKRLDTNEIIDEKYVDVEGSGMRVILTKAGLDLYITQSELKDRKINSIPIKPIDEKSEDKVYELFFAKFSEEEHKKEKSKKST